MLSWFENVYSRPLFRRAILTRKVGQTDLVFGVPSGFISRSVCARLQVAVCSGYDLFHPIVNTQTHIHRQRNHHNSPSYSPIPPVPKMKFLGQGFQKLEHEQDRQTDRRDRTHYYAAFAETAGGRTPVDGEIQFTLACPQFITSRHRSRPRFIRLPLFWSSVIKRTGSHKHCTTPPGGRFTY